MHNPDPVKESETHRLLWNSSIKTDHLISARRPDLEIVNDKKENLPNNGLCLCGRSQVKTKRKKKKKEG